MTRLVSAEEARGLLEGATPGPLVAARLCAAAPDLAATVIALSEERDRYRAALDAIARAHRATGACVPECSSWSEDYRINDCDCGYYEAGEGAGVFAVDVLDGTTNLNGAYRQAAADRAAIPK